MTDTTYFDHAWHGPIPAMSAALAAIGWAPDGVEPTALRPVEIAGIVGPHASLVDGAARWTALIRATVTLPFPAGVGAVPAGLDPDPREALGAIAALSPRVITAKAFFDRFTREERIAMRGDAVLDDAERGAGFQGTVNLASAEAAQLLAYATAKGFLVPGRAAEILA